MVKGLRNNEKSLTKEVKLISMRQVPTTNQLKIGELGVDVDGQNLYLSDGIKVKKAARGAGAPSLDEVSKIGNKTSETITSGTTTDYTTISKDGIEIINDGNVVFSIDNEVVSGSTDLKDSFVDWLDITIPESDGYTFDDTNSVDFTVTPQTDPDEADQTTHVKADIKISDDYKNSLAIKTDGLYMSSETGLYGPVKDVYPRDLTTENIDTEISKNTGWGAWLYYTTIPVNVEVTCSKFIDNGDGTADIEGSFQSDRYVLFTNDNGTIYPRISLSVAANYNVVIQAEDGTIRQQDYSGVPAGQPIDFVMLLTTMDWDKKWAFNITYTAVIQPTAQVVYSGYFAANKASQPLPTSPSVGDRYCTLDSDNEYVIAEWSGTEWLYTKIVNGGMFVSTSTFDQYMLQNSNLVIK